MVLLGAEYASSDEEHEPSASKDDKMISSTTIVAAPEVSLDVWSQPSI